MLPRLMLALVLALSFASTSCQSYTNSLEQSVARADETGVIAALRAIGLAQRTYSLTNSGDYGTFQQLADGGFLDAKLSRSKQLKDYTLTMKVIPKAAGAPEGSYTCNADPEKQGASAGRHFYIDSSSTDIHVNPSQPATAADPLNQ